MRTAGEYGKNILIVDDTPENLTVLRKILAGAGYRVRPALSAELAMKAVHAELPDLILLDVMMPGTNGYELCATLKADAATRDVPVLFISALSDTDDKVRGFNVGALDFITKPFQPEEVLSRIKTHLELRNTQLALQRRNEQLGMEIEERQRVEEALAEANRKLEKLATVDMLTQVANRRMFEEVLTSEWARMCREKETIALIMCDIDFFKRFNDTYGHPAGDGCLRRVAAVLARMVSRPADLVARYGGEEFVVILPGTTVDGARLIAEQIRNEIRAMAIPHAGSQVGPFVSLSFGVAATVPLQGFTPDGLVKAADQALYQAKEAGRDTICLHE